MDEHSNRSPGTCTRPCVYRNRSGLWDGDYGCCYLEMTGLSRTAVVYRITGHKRLTARVREMLKPENCPCFLRDPAQAEKGPPAGPPRSPKFNAETFMRLYHEGKTDAEIGKEMDVAPQTVGHWRKLLRLPMVPRKAPESKLDWDAARLMLAEGRTDSDIARALGCTPVAVMKWRQRNGLAKNPARPPKK